MKLSMVNKYTACHTESKDKIIRAISNGIKILFVIDRITSYIFDIGLKNHIIRIIN